MSGLALDDRRIIRDQQPTATISIGWTGAGSMPSSLTVEASYSCRIGLSSNRRLLVQTSDSYYTVASVSKSGERLLDRIEFKMLAGGFCNLRETD